MRLTPIALRASIRCAVDEARIAESVQPRSTSSVSPEGEIVSTAFPPSVSIAYTSILPAAGKTAGKADRSRTIVRVRISLLLVSQSSQARVRSGSGQSPCTRRESHRLELDLQAQLHAPPRTRRRDHPKIRRSD